MASAFNFDFLVIKLFFLFLPSVVHFVAFLLILLFPYCFPFFFLVPLHVFSMAAGTKQRPVARIVMTSQGVTVIGCHPLQPSKSYFSKIKQGKLVFTFLEGILHVIVKQIRNMRMSCFWDTTFCTVIEKCWKWDVRRATEWIYSLSYANTPSVCCFERSAMSDALATFTVSCSALGAKIEILFLLQFHHILNLIYVWKLCAPSAAIVKFIINLSQHGCFFQSIEEIDSVISDLTASDRCFCCFLEIFGQIRWGIVTEVTEIFVFTRLKLNPGYFNRLIEPSWSASSEYVCWGQNACSGCNCCLSFLNLRLPWCLPLQNLLDMWVSPLPGYLLLCIFSYVLE